MHTSYRRFMTDTTYAPYSLLHTVLGAHRHFLLKFNLIQCLSCLARLTKLYPENKINAEVEWNRLVK